MRRGILFGLYAALIVAVCAAGGESAHSDPNPGHEDIMRDAVSVPPPSALPTGCKVITSEGDTPAQAPPGRVNVQFRAATATKDAERLIVEHGGTIVGKVPVMRFYVVAVSPDLTEVFIDRLKLDPSVLFAQPDFLLSGEGYTATPNEGIVNYQREIGAPEAWGLLQDRPPVRQVSLGIIDIGFAGLKAGENDFSNRLRSPLPGDDRSNHGTLVAAVAASSGNNGSPGNLGINWTCDLYIGPGEFTSFVSWSLWDMLKNGVEVINISVGAGSAPRAANQVCEPGEAALQRRFIRNVAIWMEMVKALVGKNEMDYIVVLGAGNDNCDLGADLGDTVKPDNLVIVGGSRGVAAAPGSNRGKIIDIAAPYEIGRLYSYQGGEYGTYQGTSYAAPQVAGAAALIWAYDPGLITSQDVVARLKKTSLGLISDFGGAGVLQVHKALGKTAADVPTQGGVRRDR